MSVEDLENLRENHPEFMRLCRELSDYAKLHNIPRDLMFDGVCWDGYFVKKMAHGEGRQCGRIEQSVIVAERLGLVR